jgi:hypothetical protein
MTTGEQLVSDYLSKLGQHDLAGCLDYFNEDSVLEVRAGIERGLAAIERWHKERFQANLAILSIDSVKQNGKQTTADFVMTSDRLAGRRMEHFPVRLSVTIESGKVATAHLKLRLGASLKSLIGLK